MIEALGGLGLFLLGMTALTAGLRGFAGGALRRSLARFTRSPFTGAVTGAVSTILVQSSSATTVAAVGFVGAGLLTFPQSIGIILGANVGSTVTGWLVALIGFELGLGDAVLPVIFAGALLARFGRGRWPRVGEAFAGFGMVFLGISFLQEGMAGFAERFTPESLPGDTIGGRLALVLLGIAITILTQSSAAGVAMAMSALAAGSIAFPQAAALVIGMDIGTTNAALLAAIGAPVHARRTGYAHVIFNLFTAAGAFLLLSPYIAICERTGPNFLQRSPEIGLVLFHSSFNLLGSAIALPLAGAFARLIVRLVRAEGRSITEPLDSRLLRSPERAIAAVGEALRRASGKACALLAEAIERGGDLPRDSELDEIEGGVHEIRRYLGRLFPGRRDVAIERDYDAAVHVLDHLERLADRLRRRRPLAPERIGTELVEQGARLAREMRALAAGAAVPANVDLAIRALWEELEQGTEVERHEVLRSAVAGELDLEAADERLDAHRWIRRSAYHVWRIRHHLAELDPEGALR